MVWSSLFFCASSSFFALTSAEICSDCERAIWLSSDIESSMVEAEPLVSTELSALALPPR